MKIFLDIGIDGQPSLKFKVEEGSNYAYQKNLKRFVEGAFSKGIEIIDIDAGDKIEVGNEREYEIRIKN